jgi:uncharacterized MAPEG superfamily protein
MGIGTIAYFFITQIPPMITNKTGKVKNKVFKPKRAILYLTFIIIYAPFYSIFSRDLLYIFFYIVKNQYVKSKLIGC